MDVKYLNKVRHGSWTLLGRSLPKSLIFPFSKFYKPGNSLNFRSRNNFCFISHVGVFNATIFALT